MEKYEWVNILKYTIGLPSLVCMSIFCFTVFIICLHICLITNAWRSVVEGFKRAIMFIWKPYRETRR